MKRLTTKRVIVRITIIIASVELLLMLLLRNIPHGVGTYSEAALDAVMLVLLSTPAIYIWIIKPFVSARDEALAQIIHLAHTDPLTGLANRRSISEHLEMVLASSIRHREHGAVLLLDLDGFKLVNDSYGHEAGDALLVEIAARLQKTVRSEEIVGRIGGDEFVVLIHRLDADKRIAHDMILRITKGLLEIIYTPFDFNGKMLHVGASIGVRLLGFVEPDTETVMNEVDIAMYRAKKAGKGCVVFFEKSRDMEPSYLYHK